jgi:hypothetical protein
LIIDVANDDIGACEIVINHYKDVLIICKGVLYVYHDDNDICLMRMVQSGQWMRARQDTGVSA